MSAGMLFYSGKGIRDIEKILGTGAAGSTDTYCIFYTDDSVMLYSVVNGANGANGQSPYIKNGNWWIGNSDLGVSATPDLTSYSTKTQADLLYKPFGYEPNLSAYYTLSQNDVRYLGINAQAADSAKLGGHLPSYFQVAGNYESPLTFSGGLSRTGNTVISTISQYTDTMADARVSNAMSAHLSAYNHGNIATAYNWVNNYGYTDYVRTGDSRLSDSRPANGGISSQVTTAYNQASNANYQLLWGSNNYIYGNSNIYCNPYTGQITASQFNGSLNGTANYASTAGSAPASDVYSWAKQPTKPTTLFSEIGSKPTTLNGYGIIDTPWTSYLLLVGGTLNGNLIINNGNQTIINGTLTQSNNYQIQWGNSNSMIYGHGTNSTLNFVGASTFSNSVTAPTISSNNSILSNSLFYKKNGITRWEINGIGTESGSNSGSDIGFYRFDDSGSYLGQAININRGTGNVAFSGTLTASSFIGSGSSLTGVASSLSVNYASSTGNATTVGGYSAAQLMASGGNYDLQHSFSTSGYQKFSNGLILQWGTGKANASQGFSIYFPNACLNITATINTTDNVNESICIYNITQGAFYCAQQNQSKPYKWFAIGY